MIIDQEPVDKLSPETIPMSNRPRHLSHSPASKPSKPQKARGVLYGKLVVSTVMLALLAGSTVGMASMPISSDVQIRTIQSVGILGIEPAVPASENAVSTPTPAPTPAPVVEQVEPPVVAKPGNNAVIGTVSIPKLWGDGNRTVHMGTSNEVIDVQDSNGSGSTVVGQYSLNPMVGGKGRPYAITGHSGLGNDSPFTYIEKLEAGDIASIATSDGTYRYKYTRTIETTPDDTSVLLIPPYQEKDEVEVLAKRSMIITTCGVDWLTGWGDTSKRRIAYFDFIDFTPAV